MELSLVSLSVSMTEFNQHQTPSQPDKQAREHAHAIFQRFPRKVQEALASIMPLVEQHYKGITEAFEEIARLPLRGNIEAYEAWFKRHAIRFGVSRCTIGIVSGELYEVRFPDGTRAAVLEDAKGEIVARMIFLPSGEAGKGMARPVSDAMRKQVKQAQRGGRPAGVSRETMRDYVRIATAWKRAKAQGTPRDAFLEGWGISLSRLKTAIRLTGIK